MNNMWNIPFLFGLIKMNWYNKFLRFAYKNRFDTIAIDLCKDIFQDVRVLYYSNQEFHNLFKYRNQRLEELIRKMLERRNKDAKPININILVSKFNMANLKFKTFEVEGNTQDYSDNYSVNIQVYINANFVIEDFPKIYSRLLNVVRHEIEHVIDAANGKDTTTRVALVLPYIFQRIENISLRMLSTSEIIPYIRGIMLEAKKQHLPFSDMLRQFIQINFYSNNSSYENQLKSGDFADQFVQIENNTYNTIIERARTIFPELY